MLYTTIEMIWNWVAKLWCLKNPIVLNAIDKKDQIIYFTRHACNLFLALQPLAEKHLLI